MQLKIVVDGERLKAKEVRNFMSLSSPNKRRYSGWRSSKFEAFMQQKMIERSQSYNLCMPVMED